MSRNNWTLVLFLCSTKPTVQRFYEDSYRSSFQNLRFATTGSMRGRLLPRKYALSSGLSFFLSFLFLFRPTETILPAPLCCGCTPSRICVNSLPRANEEKSDSSARARAVDAVWPEFDLQRDFPQACRPPPRSPGSRLVSLVSRSMSAAVGP